jgi:RNA polymerase sigma factor (sigma-70 family)
MTDLDRELLQRALSGDECALRAVIVSMTPVVRARVTRVLGRNMGFGHAQFAQEVADFTQEVFMALFANDANVLHAWDPERGLSFFNFVGLIAQRKATEIVRTRRWRSHTHEFAVGGDRVASLAAEEPADELGPRQMMERVLSHLESTLSLRAWDLFERLYVRDQTVEEVCAATGLRVDAVYQWRSRLAKAAREAMQAIERSPTADQIESRSQTGTRRRTHNGRTR